MRIHKISHIDVFRTINEGKHKLIILLQSLISQLFAQKLLLVEGIVLKITDKNIYPKLLNSKQIYILFQSRNLRC